ncbi:MAG: WD40/YVTN/BNR-like repeat-containing protein [Thermoanaerobaculales bacterium]
MGHGIVRLWCGVVAAMITLAPASHSVHASEWTNLGPEGGEVLSFAVDPQPDGTIFSGTTSGIFKSEDGGRSWQLSGLVGERILSLAVDPAQPNTVFAGTDSAGPGAGGVFVTTDGGIIWAPARNGLEDPAHPETNPSVRFRSITSVLVDRHDPDTIWAGTNENGGLYASSDGGGTWSHAQFSDDVETLAADPADARTIFVSLQASGLYRTVDSGATWSFIGSDLRRFSPNGLGYYPLVHSLAIAPTDPAIIYAVTTEEVVKSSDGGDHWHSLGGLPSSVLGAAILRGVAVDQHDADTAYVATRLDGVFRTRDGGASWEQIGEGLECGPDNGGVAYKRSAVLATNPSGGLLLGTQRDGVFVRGPEAQSWVRSNSGFHAVSVASIAVNPRNPRHLLAATRGLGVFSSADGGESWAPANIGIGGACGPPDYFPWAGPLSDCRVMTGITWPRGGGDILASGECGLFGSPNGGASWHHSRSPGPWIGNVAIVPGDPRQVYASQDGWNVMHSTDGGLTWSLFVGFPYGTGVLDIAVSPEDGSTVFIGTGRGLYSSHDGGATWDGPAPEINNECPGGDWTSVSAVAFAPRSSRALFAGTSCGVFASDDGGESWRKTGLSDVDVSSLAFGRTEIYAGTWGDGVWASSDSGVSWTRISHDNGNPYITDLSVDPIHGKLYASTQGNGVDRVEIQRPVPRKPGRRLGGADVRKNEQEDRRP